MAPVITVEELRMIHDAVSLFCRFSAIGKLRTRSPVRVLIAAPKLKRIFRL
jgi:hypothetical protein